MTTQRIFFSKEGVYHWPSNIPGFTTVTCPKCKRSWRLRDWTVSFNMKSHEETCRGV